MANKYKVKNLLERNDVEEFARDYIKILSIMLRKEDKVASGALLNSLSYRIEEGGNELLIIIDSNSYMKFVDEGRRPGRYPNMRSLSRWLSYRGIDQKALFPIARRIAENGIKSSNVLDKTIREIQNSTKLVKKYEDALVDKVEDIIIAQFELN